MGAFGTGILENDSTVDYLITICELYELKLGRDQIRKMMLSNHMKDGDDSFEYDIDRYTEFWTAITFSEWLYDEPSEESKLKINKIIISSKPEYYSWSDPKERYESIKTFSIEIQTPRPRKSKRYTKIWFWENTTLIASNLFSEELNNRYRVLAYLHLDNNTICKLLLDGFKPLTEDFEEAFFWITILQCEIEFNKVRKETLSKIEEVQLCKKSFRVLRVAYGEYYIDVMLKWIDDLLEKIKDEK